MNDRAQSKPSCERCASLRQRFQIRSPADLAKAIRIARDHVANGTIVEVPSFLRNRSPQSYRKVRGKTLPAMAFAAPVAASYFILVLTLITAQVESGVSHAHLTAA